MAGSKAVEGRYQTLPGSVSGEKCSPWGQSRQHLHFHHWHRAPSKRRVSNNACKNPTSLSSLLEPQEFLCRSAAEHSNGCALFLTNQTSPQNQHAGLWGTLCRLKCFQPLSKVSHNTVMQCRWIIDQPTDCKAEKTYIQRESYFQTELQIYFGRWNRTLLNFNESPVMHHSLLSLTRQDIKWTNFLIKKLKHFPVCDIRHGN